MLRYIQSDAPIEGGSANERGLNGSLWNEKRAVAPQYKGLTSVDQASMAKSNSKMVPASLKRVVEDISTDNKDVEEDVWEKIFTRTGPNEARVCTRGDDINFDVREISLA